MFDMVENLFRSVGVEVKVHGYYKNIEEVFYELHRNWDNLPIEAQENFKIGLINLLTK